MLWSGHASSQWRCSLCSPGWVPGPDDPPEAEIWESRNCQHLPPPAGEQLDLPYAPEETRCPRRWLAQESALVELWLMHQDTGALPLGADRPGELPAWLLDAFQALSHGRMIEERRAEAEERRDMLLAVLRALGARI